MHTLRTKLNPTEAGFDIYNSEKAHISEKANITGGGELRHNILVGPSISYYLQVRDYYASASGQYLVKVSPLKSYDRFEPNDSILNPTVMEIDSSLQQAHIMDEGARFLFFYGKSGRQFSGEYRKPIYQPQTPHRHIQPTKIPYI
jgi:hypothetical protein